MNIRTRRELSRLLSALHDGVLADAEQERLGELLQQDEEAREYYLDFCDLHFDLSRTGETGGAAVSVIATNEFNDATTRGAQAFVPAAWQPVLIVASLLLLLVGGTVWVSWPDDTVNSPAIATLVHAEDVQWGGVPRSVTEDFELGAGRLTLRAGSARIRMNSGAELLLHGPAELDLIDGKAVRLHRGNVIANVPETAVGFRIITPTADVVDLGTEFAVAVEGDGSTEVHVSRGVVVARAAGSDGVVPILHEEAGRIDALQGDITTIRFDSSRFPGLSRPAVEPAGQRAGDRDDPPLPDGTHVVFLGDRATDRETHLLLIHQALAEHAPQSDLQLFNAGVSFPLLSDDNDFAVHIEPLMPTHAVLEFGSDLAMNTGRHVLSQDGFEAAITRLIDHLERRGIEPILSTGFPLDERYREGRMRLAGYNRFLRELAAERGYRLADYETQFQTCQGQDLLAGNGHWPSFAGHREMARALLQAFGYPHVEVPNTLELSLLPGVVTDWWFVHKTVDMRLDGRTVRRLQPDGEWTRLTLPQEDDKFARRLADATHSITYRDRMRGFATNLYRPGTEGIIAAAQVDAEQPRDVCINVGATLQTVWLNGEKIYDSRKQWRGWHAGKHRIPARLQTGSNTIVIEAGSSFFLSMTKTCDWSISVPETTR